MNPTNEEPIQVHIITSSTHIVNLEQGSNEIIVDRHFENNDCSRSFKIQDCEISSTNNVLYNILEHLLDV